MSPRTKYLLYALLGALGVFVYSQWSALTNPYVIMDDVRQQTYWMQKWRDPELFQNDLLSEYAQNYVSWGVQAIYALTAPFIDPLQFGKILSGILYLLTAGFLFGLGSRFRDELRPFLSCAFSAFSAISWNASPEESRRASGIHCSRHICIFCREKTLSEQVCPVIIRIGINPICFSALPCYAWFVPDR